MGESNTVVSAYTLYRLLQKYCSNPSICVNAIAEDDLMHLSEPRPCGSVVSMIHDLWSGGCEFETRFRRPFFPAYFSLSLQLWEK